MKDATNIWWLKSNDKIICYGRCGGSIIVGNNPEIY